MASEPTARRDTSRETAREPAEAVATPPHPFDRTAPTAARRYDRWKGGKDHFAADRRSADRIEQAFPSVRTAAVQNRGFVRRAVRYLAAQAGVCQFLDIGVGLPDEPNVHDIAQQATPKARVVYVDNDLMVIAHARALLTGKPDGVVSVVSGDLRHSEAILDDPGVVRVIDFTQPVALLLCAVLHFLDDQDEARAAVDTLRGRLSPGSYVVLSHATLDYATPQTVAVSPL